MGGGTSPLPPFDFKCKLRKMLLTTEMSFEDLGSYVITRIIQTLIETEHFRDFASLSQTNYQIYQISWEVAMQELEKEESLPPDPLLGTSGSRWHDAQNRLHRNWDLPAVIESNGIQRWYQHGKIHRGGDRPDVVMTLIGQLEWHQNQDQTCRLHREGDRPALVLSDGTQKWCRDGELHRDGDQPAVIESDGEFTPYESTLTCFPRLDRKRLSFRVDKNDPIPVSSGLKLITIEGKQHYQSRPLSTRKWYQHGLLHREGDQPAIVHADGTLEWYIKGQRHREQDQPAWIGADGTREWYQHDQHHRDGDRPAIIRVNGTQEWYVKNQHHRENDQPAIIDVYGGKVWYHHGLIHRENDQPARITTDGTQIWYRKGEKHREGDQPAVLMFTGRKEWWKHDRLHREKGPAVITENGEQLWYRYGKLKKHEHALT